MTAEEASVFDHAATETVARYESGGWLDLTVVAQVTWGRVVGTG